MPIELFGFSLGRSDRRKNVSTPATTFQSEVKNSKSFVPPEIDDAYTVDAGGVFGTYVDLDGQLRNENEYIKKYTGKCKKLNPKRVSKNLKAS